MNRKVISVCLVIASLLIVTALYYALQGSRPLVDAQPSAAPSQPVPEPPQTSTTVVDTSSQDVPTTPVTGDESDLLSCAGALSGPEVTSVRKDQVYELTIPDGGTPVWALPFDVEPGQNFNLITVGRNSDTEIGPCTTKTRQIVCDAIFSERVINGSPWSCVDLKLADGSSKKVKVIARLDFSSAAQGPPDLEKHAIKRAAPVLGFIVDGNYIESTIVPGATTYGPIKIWDSSGPDAKLLGEVSTGSYFPPYELEQEVYYYYDKVGDRYLTDMFTHEKLWVSGVSVNPLAEFLQGSLIGICLADYAFCTETQTDSCRAIVKDPDNGEESAEAYLDTLSYEKVVTAGDQAWITLKSSRKKTSLPRLYITVETFKKISTTYCD
jgi:hypothetical protein